MHRIPSSRAGWRVIDGERVCAAIDALESAGGVPDWAALFAALGDPGRLSLLLAIHAAGLISVSDLAVATGLRDTVASQGLRRLREMGLVAAERNGKVIRYRLADERLHEILHLVLMREPARG